MLASASFARNLKLMGLAALATLFMVQASCATSGKSTLRFLQTTDVHGFYSTPVAKDGKARPGGMRALAALVDAERARGDAEIVLLDGGDMWSGTILSDRTEGAAGIRLFNALKYDAVALGNHEFDYGPPGSKRVAEGRAAFGALAKRLDEAIFPVLASNLRDRATGKRPTWLNFKPSVVLHRGGWKIGVVGAITERTPSITFPYVGRALIFDDPIESIAKEAKRLRIVEKVDMVVVVAHIGGNCRLFEDPKDLGSCIADSNAFKIARGVPKGLIQAIFGGHTHRRVAHFVNGVAVIQAGRHARAVGVLEVEADSEGGPIVSIKKHRDVLLGTANTSSKTTTFVDRILKPMEVEVSRIRGERLGARVVDALTRSRVVSSPMGAFVCDTLKALHPDRDICLLNSGGIRKDFPKGDLTYGQLYDSLPFGNAVGLMEIDGKTLLELVRMGVSGAHGVLQTAGLTIKYDRSRDACPKVDRSGDGKLTPLDRDRVVEVLAAGVPIDPAKTYKIVTSSFLASGGDDFGVVLNAAVKAGTARIRLMHDQPSIREQVGGALRKNRPILNSPDNRVLPKPRVWFVGKVVNERCGQGAPEGHHH